MGRSPGMAPHAQPHVAQLCATGTSDGISAALIYAGADYLLAGGADANALYRLPDGRTVTPLTWAALCAAPATYNSTAGWDKRYPGFSIKLPLDAGACSEAEVDRLYDASWDGGAKFPEDFSYFHWWTLWGRQEAKAAGSAVKPALASWRQHHGGYDRELVEAALATARAWAKKAAERYARAYPLHRAVAANNLTAVTALLASGKFDVNGRDYRGLTPLQAGMACEKSDVDCWTPVEPVEIAVAEYLVSKGADVRLDVYPGSGYTLLHKAAFRGLTRLVKVLLKGGADPNAVYYAEDDKQRKDPQTPLTRAASHCSVDEAVRDSLRLHHGIDESELNSLEGAGPDSTNGTITALLDAGAKLLPFGKERPLISLFSTPASAKKCVKIGACTEAQATEQDSPGESEQDGYGEPGRKNTGGLWCRDCCTEAVGCCWRLPGGGQACKP
uniref:Uncharacterized protein n=1 Tax=Tetradesmus obliquus TaxID=3088 RepID=A0A383WDI0_TETOB|eukprot:jgi/Sobl393_1/4476/SZX75054.1